MQLPPEVQKKLESRLSELPKPLREAITSETLAPKIRTIAEKHGLNLWQGQILENEISLALVGLEDREGFTDAIRNQLEIGEGEANAITNDVDAKIFAEIRTTLQKTEGDAGPQREGAGGKLEADNKTEIPFTQETSEEVGKENVPEEDADLLETTARENSTSVDLNNKVKNKEYGVDPYREPVE